LLVAMTLILVVVSAAAGIFLYVSRIQHRIIANQQIQGDVRFAMESLVRDLHIDQIDYSYYQSQGISLVDAGGVAQAVQILALRDSSYQPVLYRFNAANKTLEVSRGTAGTWNTLLSDTVEVTSTRFYIMPATDPFQVCGTGSVSCATVPNEQPRVTLAIAAQNVPDPANPPTVIILQTTAVARSYQR
jgi:hypothetical protein